METRPTVLHCQICAHTQLTDQIDSHFNQTVEKQSVPSTSEYHKGTTHINSKAEGPNKKSEPNSVRRSKLLCLLLYIFFLSPRSELRKQKLGLLTI